MSPSVQIHLFASLLAACTVAAAALPAQAQSTDRPADEACLPALSAGATGLLEIPSASLQRSGEATVFASAGRIGSGGLLVGLANRLELGLAVGTPETRSTLSFGSAKLSLLPEGLLTPAISVGVTGASDGSTNRGSGYLVASKDLIPYFLEALTGQQHLALKLHAGFGNGRYRDRPFAGAELWGDGGLGAVADISAGHASLGARYYHQGVGATIGWLDMKQAAASVSYAIGLR